MPLLFHLLVQIMSKRRKVECHNTVFRLFPGEMHCRWWRRGSSRETTLNRLPLKIQPPKHSFCRRQQPGTFSKRLRIVEVRESIVWKKWQFLRVRQCHWVKIHPSLSGCRPRFQKLIQSLLQASSHLHRPQIPRLPFLFRYHFSRG